MQFLVIGWLVLEITESSAQLGLVISLYGIPNVSVLLVAGVVADRFQRRYVLMATQTAVAGIVAALAFLTVADLVEVWHIYAGAVLLGVTQGINMPARTTLIGDLVEEDSILDGVALNSAAMQAGSIIGPPLAGVIIEVGTGRQFMGDGRLLRCECGLRRQDWTHPSVGLLCQAVCIQRLC
jgi:MFS family permease